MTVSYEGDACVVSFEVKPFMYNPQGSLHGGVLATALDISMGHLLKQHFGAGATLEMKVQYFAPLRGGAVTCRAGFLKKGRKTFFLQSYDQDLLGAVEVGRARRESDRASRGLRERLMKGDCG
jgi:uncharacterized protein (TIGR00369 family)